MPVGLWQEVDISVTGSEGTLTMYQAHGRLWRGQRSGNWAFAENGCRSHDRVEPCARSPPATRVALGSLPRTRAWAGAPPVLFLASLPLTRRRAQAKPRQRHGLNERTNVRPHAARPADRSTAPGGSRSSRQRGQRATGLASSPASMMTILWSAPPPPPPPPPPPATLALRRHCGLHAVARGGSSDTPRGGALSPPPLSGTAGWGRAREPFERCDRARSVLAVDARP